MSEPGWAAALCAAWCALAMTAAGCSVQDIVASRPCPPGDTCASDNLAQYCAGTEPPMLVNADPDGPEVCAGTLAGRAFEHALCVCRELTVGPPLATDSFDSVQGAYNPGGPGSPGNSDGSVGVNDKLEATGDLHVGGSLAVAGPEGINANAALTVAGDLRSAGQLGSVNASVTVDGDADVAGSIELAEASIAGVLTVPVDQTIAVSGPLVVGETRRAPVAVTAPCPCAEAAAIDVSGFIDRHRLSNHNAEAGLDPTALRDLAADTTLELPCGRFYLDSVQAPAHSVHIRVAGRVALFIDRGVTVGGDLWVEVVPDAELDLFIAGNINVGGDVLIGDSTRPRQIRMYVADGGAINLSASSALNGNLYAPGVALFLAAGAEVFGALVVNQLLYSAPVSVHRDTAIRTVTDRCPTP